MKWEDLEIGDELEFTDEMKKFMIDNDWDERFQELKNITVKKINVYDAYILINIGKWGGVPVDRSGILADGDCEIECPVVFKITKLKDN